MTAPSKVHAASVPLASGAARAHKPRRFPVSDGAPVEVVEDGPSVAGRLFALAAMLTIKPTLTVGSLRPEAAVAVGAGRLRLRGCCGPPLAPSAPPSGCRTAPRSWSVPRACCPPTASAASCSTCTAGRS